MRVRQSTIRKWMECPLQAKFSEIELKEGPLNAKTAFGTCIHFALEEYNQHGDVDKAVAVWKDVWANPEKLNATPDFYPKMTSHKRYMARGIEILVEYDQKNQWDQRRVVASEHRFLVPFGDHEITGTIDLLEMRQGRQGWVLRIVDYKSKSKQPTAIQLRQDIQFTTYYYASLQPEFWLGNGPEFPPMDRGEFLWERLRDAQRRVVWYALWFNKEFDAGDRNDRDFMRLHRVVDMMKRSIEADVFVPNISGETCTYCPYHKECGLPFPEEVEALAEAV